jgi:hypothetical protein
VYISRNITENEIFFNRKLSGPSPRVSRPGGAMVHGGPAAPSSTGAHRVVPRGTKAHRGGAGRERATTRSSPRPKSSGAVTTLRRRRRGMEHGSAHG